MKLEIEVSEFKSLMQQVHKPEELFEMIRVDMREMVGKYLSGMMKAELSDYLGRNYYEREQVLSRQERNYRNGNYERKIALKGVGEVEVKVPRDRLGTYQTQVLRRSQRIEGAIAEDISLLFLSGCSTRILSLLSRRLLGKSISASKISQYNQELTQAVENWRSRDLSLEKIQYLYIDGVNFRMRINKKIELVPVLVIIGVTTSGFKIILGMQAGDKESAVSWREFFKDLKGRGLNYKEVQLGIMDGLAGLEKVFKEEFPNSVIQRCQVHVARNILAKVSKKHKKEVADHLRNIFYASSKPKAMSFTRDFIDKYVDVFPSAVQCLEKSLDNCLTYLKFPNEEWAALRTTNPIERVNKEFKRRTKPMEIVAGENACYRLLAFIAIKMECHWRTTPIGKMNAKVKNFNFFKKIKHL